jgi:hypothetical protein
MRMKLELVLDVGDAAVEDARAYLGNRRGQIPLGNDDDLGLVQEAALDLFEAALANSPLDWWEIDRSRTTYLPDETG